MFALGKLSFLVLIQCKVAFQSNLEWAIIESGIFVMALLKREEIERLSAATGAPIEHLEDQDPRWVSK